MSRNRPSGSSPDTDGTLDRRTFLGVGAGAGLAAQFMATADTAQAAVPGAPPIADLTAITMRVNGRRRSFQADPRTTLLDALRENLGLTGSKKGCDHGQCGACTVHIDGRRVLGCLTLAVAVRDRAITTIEGLSSGKELHPMQQAFIDHDAFQCGYCTPGQIMSAVAMVNEGNAETDDQIREHISGNLCRCAAYPNIVAAIRDAKPRMAAGRARGRG